MTDLEPPLLGHEAFPLRTELPFGDMSSSFWGHGIPFWDVAPSFLGYGAFPLGMLSEFRVFITVKRHHGHSNYDKENIWIGMTCLQFQMFSPSSSCAGRCGTGAEILHLEATGSWLTVTPRKAWAKQTSKPAPKVTYFLQKDHTYFMPRSKRATPFAGASSFKPPKTPLSYPLFVGRFNFGKVEFQCQSLRSSL